MSQTAITLAFEQHLADLQMGAQPVIPDEFVLAHVPGLDLTAPINRAAGLPPPAQIVHRQPVDQRGKVNANGVAYSIIMDTRIGDFTFNAMYLVHKASGLVAMVVHKAAEDKLKNQGNSQPGNSLVKSMLMEYLAPPMPPTPRWMPAPGNSTFPPVCSGWMKTFANRPTITTGPPPFWLMALPCVPARA
ncbi:phage tail protein [Oceanisphaera psychrotolerans]|uniref:Phage tail fibre protein N-terminal domain-containing protein n=1 Tax=Oceanisphaera psychrotolerans TaxID=1414654 RepID=A0A1J4QEV2_9GAMM|nr:phage tail protein [Oceanisphaera psychrotolerans]OIN09072.1 hypothetical protein BFR47_02005 [Oceanisphaera psychrotolerans]